MDYPYFTAAPQPQYQFLQVGLPPTPAHTHPGSAHSDDYSNSPPVREFHKVQPYSQSFLTPKQDAFEFQNFDAFNHFPGSNGLPTNKPPTPISQHKGSIGGGGTTHTYEVNSVDVSNNTNQQGGSNSDDDDMTPAQSRRKAQNRAA